MTVTLVLGGARSGKSAVAERLAGRLGEPVTYVATAVPPGSGSDDDFAGRIEAHRARRPSGWRTVEVGADLPSALAAIEGVALVDSLGTWVAGCPDPDVAGLCSVLVMRPSPTVLVSDEVGLGVHPFTDVGRRFRDVLGAANTAVADIADDVLLVVAGRVLSLPRAPGD